MTPEQIQKMAEGCPPSAIGKDHEEVVTWLAEKHIELQEQVQKLAAEGETMLHLLTEISENYWESQTESEDSIAVIDLDYISEINTYIGRDVEAENPFDATDAVIREIGARRLMRSQNGRKI